MSDQTVQETLTQEAISTKVCDAFKELAQNSQVELVAIRYVLAIVNHHAQEIHDLLNAVSEMPEAELSPKPTTNHPAKTSNFFTPIVDMGLEAISAVTGTQRRSTEPSPAAHETASPASSQHESLRLTDPRIRQPVRTIFGSEKNSFPPEVWVKIQQAVNKMLPPLPQ